MKPSSKKKNKNVSYFSNEFIITNHGDIAGILALVIFLGLLTKITYPISSLFTVFHPYNAFNETDNTDIANSTPYYVMEKADIFKIVFYTLAVIMIHEILQDSVLDKLNKKLHLSKSKFVKFNESGHLAFFYLLSLVWFFVIWHFERHIQHLSDLWEGYPHGAYSLLSKVFFIIQICYWVHQFPELYLRRIKREDMSPRIIYSLMNLMAFGGAYFLNMTRIASCLMVVHYFVELFFHLTRIIHFIGYTSISLQLFHLWNGIFVIARMATATLAYLVFQYGFSKYSIDTINLSEGNFNTKLIRLNVFIFVIVVQAYMMWNFINFHMKRIRESSTGGGGSQSRITFVTNTDLQRMRRNKKKAELDSGEDNTPTGANLRNRKVNKS